MLDKVKFNFSSRNAESLVSSCRAHIFVSALHSEPSDLARMEWKYVLTGITALLRNKVYGKKSILDSWQTSLCLVDMTFGITVWTGILSTDCSYSVIGDRFHVFELSEVQGLMGILFESEVVAAEFQATYHKWFRERSGGDKKEKTKDLSALVPRFTREMISKPCNFQHISGSQALEQILDVEKVKSDVCLKIKSIGPAKEGVDAPQDKKKKVSRSSTLTGASYEGFPIPIPSVPKHRLAASLRRARSDANVADYDDPNGHIQGPLAGSLVQQPVAVSGDSEDSAITSLSGEGDLEENHDWLNDVLKSVSLDADIEPTWQALTPEDFQRTFVYSTMPRNKRRSPS